MDGFDSAIARAQESYLGCVTESYRGMVAADAKSLGDLLNGEERLLGDSRAAIRPFAERGIAHAKAAIALRPDDARSHLLLAMNVGMLGLSIGKFEAFTGGIPSQVIRAYSKALEIDETCDAAGPLQLEGRFRTIVPFPYRNLRRARLSLDRATTIAPVKQTLFFLGDAHARAGDLTAAEDAWRRALAAPPHPPAQSVASYVDLLIERRLEFVSEVASLPR